MSAQLLRCCSFNILAPCYKATSRRGSTEDEDPKAWRKRSDLIFQLLLDLNCDVVCLQELWFDAEYLRVFRQAFEPQYNLHLLQRPHKQDGLAILVRSSNFTTLSLHPRDFKTVGQRIGLAARIQRIGSRDEFLVANTHLTFPHHEFDYKLRFDQIRNFSAFLGKVQEGAPEARMILCGDFNCCSIPAKDNVYRHLIGTGLRSTYYEMFGKEPGVTHLTHNNESHCVDFIFVDNKMNVRKSFLCPSHLGDEKWTPEFTLSDHRPLVSDVLALEAPASTEIDNSDDSSTVSTSDAKNT